MKVIICERPESALCKSGVSQVRPTTWIKNIWMGSGLGWSEEKQDAEIAKWAKADRGATIQRKLTPAIARRLADAFTTGGLTEDEVVQLVADKDAPPDTTAVHIVEHTELPDVMNKQRATEDFRDAVVWDGAHCVEDMGKCRAIHMDRIRGVRANEFERLDIEVVRAMESGDSVRQAEIVTEKQALRDLPTTFDLEVASTADELKVLWPDGLPTLASLKA
jgi:hypothetical protein